MIVNASYVDYERAWIFIFEFCNYKKSDAYNLLTNDVTGLSISFQNNFVFPSEVTFTISQLTWCKLNDFIYQKYGVVAISKDLAKSVLNCLSWI